MTATHVVDHIHDEPMSEVALRSVAIEALLQDKGLLTADEVRRQVNLMDGRTPADGARVVARAWTDSEFKARLLADSRSALAEMGIEIPAETPHLVVVENTEDVHNLVVCTLCSCYPRMLLGRPPDWYKSLAYRARAVSDPRGVMAEFGTELADGDSRSPCWIARPTCAIWCCRAGLPEPTA